MRFASVLPSFLLPMVCLTSFCAATRAEEPNVQTETIVFVRHGEKPAKDLGQLSCQGLNRALSLPDVLIGKYGQPNFIMAPLTETKTGHLGSFSYVRPLATIEPTAIRLGMPVNTQYSYDDIGALQAELTSSTYRNSLIFVAWEHNLLDVLVKNLMQTFGGDPLSVPDWEDTDFDSIFVIKLRTEGEKRTIKFEHTQEGLNGQSTDCPGKK